MTIQPVVEGYGEIEAVPVLLRRLISAAGLYEVSVGPPIRRRRSQFAREGEVRTMVRLARMQCDCSAILILFDSDDDCPRELAARVQAWAEEEAGGTPCVVVMAHREYEAWFLAAVESLRGKRGIRQDAVGHPEPESPRAAKAHLEEHMVAGRVYRETTDQAALTAVFEMQAAYAKCRSFRRMVRAFGLLVQGAGLELGTWPPASWVDANRSSRE